MSRVLLATSAPLHDLGSFILRNDALHLEQQVVFRALPERPVQEDYFDTGPVPLINEENLVPQSTSHANARM